MIFEYKVTGGDFDRAGSVASALKKTLRQLGIDPDIIRRIVISCYEAEVNVVAHAHQGDVRIEITTEEIRIEVNDSGPGIADIELAMKEGFSTATEAVRQMGFGAGMGLPNIARNTDRFDISSEPGKGTRLELIHKL